MDLELFKTFTISTFLYPVLLALLLLYQLSKHIRSKLPPGPYSLPVVGSVGFFREFKKKGPQLLAEVASRYGSVFSVRVGNQLVVFLNDYVSIHEAFVKQSELCSDRPNGLPSLQLGLKDGKGLIWQNLHEAIPMRKFALQTLRGFGVGKNGLEEKVCVEIDAINNVIETKLGEKLTLKPLLKKAVMNVIHHIVFGTRYTYDDARHEELQSLIDEFFKGGLFIPKNFFPKLLCKLLPKDSEAYEKKQTAMQQLKDYIYQAIDEHEQTYDDVTIRDYIDLYIKAAKDDHSSDNKQHLTRGNIFRTILDLFIAGADTTATTLEYCFLYMVNYPDIQEKCYEEINEVCKDVEYVDAKTNCPYVDAVLLEIQRLTKVAPVGMPHVTSAPIQVKEFTIPEDTIVFANLYGCCMDPDVWTHPGEFRPERHLDGDSKVVRNKQMMPFSIGPRTCLGELMAKMEIKLIFTNLIRRFKFSAVDQRDLDKPTEYHPAGRLHDFDVIATLR